MILYDFQVDTANYIVNRINQMLPVLDCSVVGAGKTFIALDVLNRVNRQFLIICPKIVITHWKEAIQQAQIEHLSMGVVNYEKIKFGNTEYFNDKYEWNLPQNSIVIFDEAHKLKGYNTFNSKLLLNLPIHIATPYLISATIADSPIAFVNVAKAFKICTNEYKFLYSFGYSRNALKAWEFDKNPQHLQRLHNIIFNIHDHPGVRITYDKITILTKTNTVKLMPIKDTYKRISHLYELIEQTGEQHYTNKHLPQPSNDDEHFFELMQKTQLALDTCNGAILDEIEQSILISYAENPLVKRTRLKQFIELIKTKLIIPKIIKDLKQGASIVIMLNYSWSIKFLYESLQKLNIQVDTITGSSRFRDSTIKQFQSNQLRVLILNIKAASVGISLHDTDGQYHRISYISPSDNIYELQQALGRIYRATSKSDAKQYFITVVDSVEICVYKNYINKLNMMSKILEGSDSSTSQVLEAQSATCSSIDSRLHMYERENDKT